jgi:tripartite-type tricarboxylate transporter receptor subunit TctC
MTQGDFFNCFSVILQRQALRALSFALLLGAGFLLHSIGSVAQTPSTLRMVIGQQAGAQIDVLGRLLAEKLRQDLGRLVLVENRLGNSGMTAVEAVKSAPADGNTLLLVPLAVMVIMPLSQKNVRFDPLLDFEAVSHVVSYDMALAVAPQLPARTLAEFYALARANPSQASFAIPGVGGLSHFVTWMIAKQAGTELLFVPYKGPQPGITDLMGGQVAAMASPLADFASLHRAGKLRVLASSGARRSTVLPEVPTFKELGYAVEANAWFAMFAPAASPKPALDGISRSLSQALRTAEVRDQIARAGLDPVGGTRDELASLLRRDFEQWRGVIKSAGFVAQ